MRTLIALVIFALLVATVFAHEHDSHKRCRDSCIATALESRSLSNLRACIQQCRSRHHTSADQEVEESEEQQQWESMSTSEFVSMAENLVEAVETELQEEEQSVQADIPAEIESDVQETSLADNEAQTEVQEVETVLADAETETEAPSHYCLKSGLNYRSSPCGSVVGTTSGSVSAKNLNQSSRPANCRAGNYNWLKVEIGGRAVWIANVAGMVSTCSSPAPSPAPSSGGISVATLRRIMPNLPLSKANEYINGLNAGMAWGKITTCPRRSAFLAQLAHESVELRYMEEIASGAAYEGRRDLGNTQPGDGRRYKGRGPIQLTGRANYRAAGNALGVNLEANPTLAATPQWGFKIAAWYWTTRNLNQYADQNTQSGFDAVTYRVNGGYNGKADRDKYWRRAKSVLGC